MKPDAYNLLYDVLRIIDSQKISSLEVLRDSVLHEEWFLASFAFAEKFAKYTCRSQRTIRVNNALGFVYEDNCQNYGIDLYSKFNTIMNLYKVLSNKTQPECDEESSKRVIGYCVNLLKRSQIDTYRRIANNKVIDETNEKNTSICKSVLAIKSVYEASSIDQEIQNSNGESISTKNLIKSLYPSVESQILSSEAILSYLEQFTALEMLGFISQALGYKNRDLLELLKEKSTLIVFKMLLVDFIKSFECISAQTFLIHFTKADFIYTGTMTTDALISHLRSQAKKKCHKIS